MPRISTHSRPFTEVVADVRQCVYSVIRHRRLPTAQRWAVPLGSAFFVADNVLLTCYHVINTVAAPHEPGDQYELVNNFGTHGDSITIKHAELGRNVHLFPDQDAALIQIANPAPEQRYVAVDFDDMPVGMDIGIAGYPLPRLSAEANGVLQYHGLVYRVARGVVTSEFRQSIQALSGDPLIRDVSTIETNFMFVAGNSGGPIFDAETGRVGAFVHGFRAEKIAEHYFDTAQPNISAGAPDKHIESLHAIYSVGIRVLNIREELERLGAGL